MTDQLINQLTDGHERSRGGSMTNYSYNSDQTYPIFIYIIRFSIYLYFKSDLSITCIHLWLLTSNWLAYMTMFFFWILCCRFLHFGQLAASSWNIFQVILITKNHKKKHAHSQLILKDTRQVQKTWQSWTMLQKLVSPKWNHQEGNVEMLTHLQSEKRKIQNLISRYLMGLVKFVVYFLLSLITSTPIGAWKCIFPPY